MFRFLRKHRALVMVALAFVILGMMFFGIGGSFFSDSPNDTVARVNGESITRGQFDRLFNQVARQRPELNAEERRNLTRDVFNELIRQQVMSEEAERYGIKVTDQELQEHLQSIPAFQRDGQFVPELYYRTVFEAFGSTPQEFETMRRKDLAAQKLTRTITAAVHLPETAVEAAVDRRKAVESGSKDSPDDDTLRREVRMEEANRVFNDWMSQINQSLRVSIVSEDLRQRLEGTL